MPFICGFHNCYPHHSNLLPDPTMMLSQHICERKIQEESSHVSHLLLFLTYHVIQIWCYSCPNLWWSPVGYVCQQYETCQKYWGKQCSLAVPLRQRFLTIVGDDRPCSAKATFHRALLNYCKHDGIPCHANTLKWHPR